MTGRKFDCIINTSVILIIIESCPVYIFLPFDFHKIQKYQSIGNNCTDIHYPSFLSVMQLPFTIYSNNAFEIAVKHNFATTVHDNKE